MDIPCCGNLGRIELLLEASDWGKVEHLNRAREIGARVVARARTTGQYALGIQNGIFVPSFTKVWPVWATNSCGWPDPDSYHPCFPGTDKFQLNLASARSLTCDLRKKGDEKHCTTLDPGTYSAQRKGDDKLIVFGWKNPLDVGNLAKATKAEYRVSAQP